MPPRHPPPPHWHAPPPPPPPRRSSSGLPVLAATDGIAAHLAPWIPDAEDRSFVARCIATEGPAHHRVASAALLRLLGMALDAAGRAAPEASAPAAEEGDIPVPFRLPPHLDRHADDDAHYPLRLSGRALARLAPPGSPEARAIADALTDGPAHHALANVAMINMLEALLQRLSRADGE